MGSKYNIRMFDLRNNFLQMFETDVLYPVVYLPVMEDFAVGFKYPIDEESEIQESIIKNRKFVLADYKHFYHYLEVENT